VQVVVIGNEPRQPVGIAPAIGDVVRGEGKRQIPARIAGERDIVAYGDGFIH